MTTQQKFSRFLSAGPIAQRTGAACRVRPWMRAPRRAAAPAGP